MHWRTEYKKRIKAIACVHEWMSSRREKGTFGWPTVEVVSLERPRKILISVSCWRNSSNLRRMDLKMFSFSVIRPLRFHLKRFSIRGKSIFISLRIHTFGFVSNPDMLNCKSRWKLFRIHAAENNNTKQSSLQNEKTWRNVQVARRNKRKRKTFTWRPRHCVLHDDAPCWRWASDRTVNYRW